MKSKLMELSNNSFSIWMKKNYPAERLEKRMQEVATEGFTGISIEVSEENDKESKLMKSKPEFIEQLKTMFPDLTVKEIPYTKRSLDIWTSRFYEVNHTRIEISWE